MRIRTLIGALAAVALVFGGLGGTASPAAAQDLPTVCTFVGLADMSPGVDPIPPYPSGTYRFIDANIVCVGSVTQVGRVTSTGTYNGRGGFSGNLDSASCDGGVAGTRTAVLVLGTAITNCGSGPVVALFVPVPVPVPTPGVCTCGHVSLPIKTAVVVGAAVLL